jgi:hypothetical protein
MDVDRVLTAPPRPAPPPPPPAPPEPVIRSVYPEDRYVQERPAFGGWLILQKGRSEWLDKLAGAAKSDPSFPKRGDPDAVRKHLGERGADGDMFEALDDAESEWLRG